MPLIVFNSLIYRCEVGLTHASRMLVSVREQFSSMNNLMMFIGILSVYKTCLHVEML